MSNAIESRGIRELFDFLRFRISLYLMSLAVSGYLIFNGAGAKILFVALGAFFISCGAYGYNAITDREEDKINRRANPFASSKAGLLAVVLCFSAGILFSSRLESVPFALSLAAALGSFAYSRFRLKKYFFVKNIYTGLTIPMSFIYGAAEISRNVMEYYFSLSLFFFIGSVVSDLRDYEGDMRAGIRTLPVRLGAAKTKRLLYSLLAVLSILFLALDARALLPLIAVLPFVFALVAGNKPRMAHTCMGMSLLVFVAWSLLIG